VSFIYHMVPNKMAGEVLHPLSELRKTWPKRYEIEIKKYDDHPIRKNLPKRIIKKIDCLQEDVIHFTPMHPHLMFKGLKTVFNDWERSQLFYEIPIERIGDQPAVYFDMNRTGTYIFGNDEPEEMFETVNAKTYKILTELPKEALEFYEQWKSRGEKGAPAMGRIPHLMVKGQVSVEKCQVIDWRDEPAK
jgi:hypothetical protein